MPTRPFPSAQPHGELRQLFDDVFFVTGSMGMPGPLPVRFSRNMTVVRQGGALTLINSVRLDDAGLARLDELGKVEHVIRIAGFHGSDDPFYKDRYDAKVWCVKGQIYAAGLSARPSKADAYFEADVEMTGEGELPIEGAELYTFPSARVPEGLLLLAREGGIVVSGDCLQNWRAPDAYFSWLAKPMMRMMGFIKPHNVGPGWLRSVKPDLAEVRGVLDLDFEHVLPAHGEAVVGGAKQAYRPVIEQLG